MDRTFRAAFLTTVLLAACGTDSASTPPAPPGLLPGAAEATEWHDGTDLVPVGFGPEDPPHPSPDALVSVMVARIREVGEPEPWIRGDVLVVNASGATASILIPLPGFEDTIVGAELRLRLARAEDGWRVLDAEVRFHCRRAVQGALCG